MVSRSTLQIHNRVIDIDEGTWVHTIHSQSGAGSCEDSVRWLSSEPSQQHPPDCTSQSWPAAHLKHTNKITAADSFSPIDWFQLKKNSINKLVHRSNYVYPFIHTHHRRRSFQDAPRWAAPCPWLGDYRKGWSLCWTYRWCQQPSVCPKNKVREVYRMIL